MRKVLEMVDSTTQAVITYLLRKLGRDRPDGRSEKGNRWYPSDSESCPCCSSIRQPSRSYPWSLYKHCFSLTHICNMYPGAVEAEVRIMLKQKPTLMGLHPAIDKWLESQLK